MKKSVFRTLCLVCVAVMMAACSNQDDYRQCIPSDVKALCAIDVASIMEKGGLKDLVKDQSSMNNLSELFSESGINLQEKVYMFMTGKEDLVCLIRLDSERKFKKFLKNEFDTLIKGEIKSDDGFSYIDDGPVAVVFNDDVAIWSMSQSGATGEAMCLRSMNWIKQKREDSFMMNKDFDVIDKEQSDFFAWVSMDVIPAPFKLTTQMSLPRDVSLDDIHYLASMRFENGKGIIRSTVLPATQAAAEMYDRQVAMMKPIQGTFLPDKDNPLFFWLGFSVDGRKFCKQLEENPDARQMVEGVTFGFNIKKLISSINGDVALGVALPDSGKQIYPVAIRAKLENNSILEDMETMQQMMTMLGVDLKKVENRKYCLKQEAGDFYFGVDRKNHFYYTSDEQLIQPDNENCRPDWTSEIDKNCLYMRMDVAQGVEMLRQIPDPKLQSLMPVLRLMDTIVLKSENNKDCTIVLNAINTEENFLKQILRACITVYGDNQTN